MDLTRGYYDISPEISADTAVFPGDTPLSRQVALDFKKGDHLVLSSIQTTLHIGAHADAPSHYRVEGDAIGARPLDPYLGPCQVIEVSVPRGARIALKDIQEIKAPRVLIKTRSFPDPNRWNDDFNSLSPELISALAKKGVKLIGIDTPSIDPAEDKTLLSHAEIFKNDLAILEGLVLDAVPSGNYTLVALPLKIRDADASPVRAILLKG